FGQAEALWFRQQPGAALSGVPDEDFWQFNLIGGYRFWRRRVEAAAGVLNLSDRDYRLHPLNVTAALPRERTFVARLKFYF
ncbi:MAG TPA: hypothetical protein VNH84_03670, partial [Candidatus Saccharimonadales bacterium]|nr:hypothetical protein [Candidatus Saccharimonadales bacterium]